MDILIVACMFDEYNIIYVHQIEYRFKQNNNCNKHRKRLCTDIKNKNPLNGYESKRNSY